ncbi:hypothetical protein BN11_4900004 [Nostocoides australiense Ben110]|uniref:Uncharacterized protein n=1 Tax=Nostocoides australiense Ben110 TaxID=1193182 RepID=W6K1C3_9MICO|nr:hypothetical protein BN11_4900004 [Tetrasphaera australiensis Ben110]
MSSPAGSWAGEWRPANTPRLVTDALRQAITARRFSGTGWDATGLIHHSDSKTVRAKVFPGFVTHTPIDPGGYRGVGGVLAAS